MAVQDLHTLDISNAIDRIFSTGSEIPGAVLSLIPETPTINVGANVPLVMGGRAKGALVHESGKKPDNGRQITPRPFNTAKIVYSQRLTEEFMHWDAGRQGDIVSRLVDDWTRKSLPRDIDTIVLHGVDPFSNKRDDELSDYLTKGISSKHIDVSGATPDDLDKAFSEAVAELHNAGEVINGIAISPDAAMKLSSLTLSGVQKYPGTGIFGLMGSTLGGKLAASTPEVGAVGNTAMVMGDWSQLLLGFAGNATWRTIEYGNPDGGDSDLQQTNQICIRMELMFGFRVLNPNAFAVVKSVPKMELSTNKVTLEKEQNIAAKEVQVTYDGEPAEHCSAEAVGDSKKWLIPLPAMGKVIIGCKGNDGKTRTGDIRVIGEDGQQGTITVTQNGSS